MSGGVDLVIVGAGPWGLSCAWRCAALGARVRVIDDGRPPTGWAAAGMLGAWSEAEEGRDALNVVLRRSAQVWPRFSHDLGRAADRDPGYLRSGTVAVADRPEHIGALRHRLAASTGPDAPPWVSAAGLRAIEPGLSPAVAGGVDLADEHQVDPRRLLEALLRAGGAAGVEVVRGIAQAVRRNAVHLASGRRLRAGRVVIAAGWGAARLGDRPRLRPVKGQILRLGARPGDETPIRRVVRTPSVYLVPRADGELVIGATSEEASDLGVSAEAVHRLLDEAIHVVPGVRDMQWREATAGLRPATDDGLPILGEDRDGVIWATGGYRHGILMSPSVADAVASLASEGEAPEWARPFSPARLHLGRSSAPCA